MRRILLIASLMLLFIAPYAGAVKYRGFVDLSLGATLTQSKPDIVKNTDFGIADDIRFAWGVTTSHGAQIFRNLYVGAGTGVIMQGVKSGMVPIFADIRCDLFSRHKANFFVGCRIGGSINMLSSEYDYDCYEYSDYEIGGYNQEVYYIKGRGGFFIQPSIGFRRRNKNGKGFGMSLSYMPVHYEAGRYASPTFGSYYPDSSYLEKTGGYPIKGTYGLFMLSLVMDF